MAMPRDGTATRQRILDAAERLMIAQGYNATSVDQVIAASSSSKGAFFHHFASKSDLAHHLVERYVRADLAHLDQALAAVADVADPAERVIAFLRFFEDEGDALMAEQSGCLYATVLAERELTGGDVDALVEAAAVAWRKGLADLLRPALDARREAVSEIDVDALADHLYVTFEGAFILCRSVGDPSAMRAQLRICRQLTEALLGVTPSA
jgi:TetR/AcrR family transcriptional repressor of nem operon